MALAKQVVKDQPFEVRSSRVHGKGAFATRRIPKGTRITEYLGERITHGEADRRYEDTDANDNHTFLFVVDRRSVIDAGIDGNDARFINHACDPNCESEIEDRRVFIDTVKDIEEGEELNYDYQIGREKGDPPNVDEIYACRCGSPKCRGTMLWPAKRPKPARRKKVKAKSKGKSGSARAKAGKSSATRRSKRKVARKGKTKSKTKGKSKSNTRTRTKGRGKAKRKR